MGFNTISDTKKLVFVKSSAQADGNMPLDDPPLIVLFPFQNSSNAHIIFHSFAFLRFNLPLRPVRSPRNLAADVDLEFFWCEPERL